MRGVFIGTLSVLVVVAVAQQSLGDWELDGALPAPVAWHGVGVVPEAIPQGILVFGGYNGAQQSATYVYQPGGGHLARATMPVVKHDMGFAAHEGRVFSVAGYQEGAGVWGRTRDVWSFDPTAGPEGAWLDETWLTYGRDGNACASLGDYVYSIGGHHEDTGHGFSLSRVERYDPLEGGGWALCAPLGCDSQSGPGGEALGRQELSVVVVDGRIYAIGGFSYEYRDPIYFAVPGCIESYDPGSDTWDDSLPAMPTPRYDCAVAAVGTRVYAVGGFDANGQYSNAVEWYDVSQGQWFSDEPFPFPVAGARAAVWNDELYVLGGHTGPDLYTNEVYVLRTYAPGDMNCDGAVNSFDIDPFVLAITNPVSYIATYPDCDVWRADVNGDGWINSFDIDPFVCILTGGTWASEGCERE